MTTKTKKQTLRQRLRDDAAIELDTLMKQAEAALGKIARPVGLTAVDLAKMVGSTQTDTLHKWLITGLADRKEAALEKLYTEQQAKESGK